MPLRSYFKLATFFLVTFAVLLGSRTCPAKVMFRLRARATATEVSIDLTNSGDEASPEVKLAVVVGGKRFEGQTVGPIAAGAASKSSVELAGLSAAAVHELVVRGTYVERGQSRSLVYVMSLSDGATRPLVGRLGVRPGRLHEQAVVNVDHDKEHELHLVLPDELRIVSQTETERGTRYRLESRLPGIAARHFFYAVLKATQGEQTGLIRIAGSQLTGKGVIKSRSLFPPWLLALVALVTLLGSFVLHRRATAEGEPDSAQVVAIRWLFSIFTVSTIFWIYRSAYVVPDWFFSRYAPIDFGNSSFGRFGWRALSALSRWLYFDGGNYDKFSRHVLDPLYLYVLIGHYFTLRWVIKPEPATDKNWHLLRTAFSLPNLFVRGRSVHWSNYTKVALLTLMVKMFYVPLVCSWSLSNLNQQRYMLSHFSLDFSFMQKWLVAVLITVDVAIFTFGYLVELPSLDNKIKSVEPTLLGWVVCLMCYPPFNSFSFVPFQYGLNTTFSPTPFWERWALGIITILWVFYTWASVALGTRASNLTNRGIVNTGPYAYVRHPAYASKCTLWAVSAIFFSDRMFFMVLGLAATYAVRAWTEERHLSLDPDYLAYKKEVPYRFIPWVW
jgi:protein-S-isoprenylcysteine O-methyltransferase Ste14